MKLEIARIKIDSFLFSSVDARTHACTRTRAFRFSYTIGGGNKERLVSPEHHRIIWWIGNVHECLNAWEVFIRSV